MQRRKVKFGQAVMVSWLDSRAFGGWGYDPTTPMTPARIVSLGYVVQSNPMGLVMTTSIGSGHQIMDALAIPWLAINDMEILPGDFSRFGPSDTDIHGS